MHEKSLQAVKLQTLHKKTGQMHDAVCPGRVRWFGILVRDVLWLDIFSDDELFESGDMHVGCFSGRVGIAAFDRVEYQAVLLRHVLRSLEVIVIYVTKSENELLELLDHLHEDLVVA